jgi:hypothetical protein
MKTLILCILIQLAGCETAKVVVTKDYIKTSDIRITRLDISRLTISKFENGVPEEYTESVQFALAKPCDNESNVIYFRKPNIQCLWSITFLDSSLKKDLKYNPIASFPIQIKLGEWYKIKYDEPRFHYLFMISSDSTVRLIKIMNAVNF